MSVFFLLIQAVVLTTLLLICSPEKPKRKKRLRAKSKLRSEFNCVKLLYTDLGYKPDKNIEHTERLSIKGDLDEDDFNQPVSNAE
jgi:hypothetical protein